MMKSIFIICFSALVGLNHASGQIEQFIFGKNEVCENVIRLENSFTGNSLKKLNDLLDKDKIDFIKSKTKCSSIEINKKKIDKVYLGVSIIEICYKDKQNQKVYNKLLKLCKEKDWKNNRILLDYFKPGKIVILDANQSIIRIISFNFCSNPKKQNGLIDYITTSNNYDEMFYVECGINNLKEFIKK